MRTRRQLGERDTSSSSLNTNIESIRFNRQNPDIEYGVTDATSRLNPNSAAHKVSDGVRHLSAKIFAVAFKAASLPQQVQFAN